MRSPPPTPRRDAAAAAAALDIEQRTRVPINLSQRTQMQTQPALQTQFTTQSRGPLKRTRDQAGLITPRPTPTTARKGPSNRVDDGTAKILFPASSKKRKVTVFQDPKTPDPFTDDLENPFLSGRSNDPPRAPDEKKGKEGSQRPELREDGMFYVFRGKKVFRPFPNRTTRSGSRAIVEEETEERGDTTAEVRPKRLFTVEIEKKRQSRARQKQSELAAASIAEDAQEEDDVLGDMLELPLDGPRMRRSLFD